MFMNVFAAEMILGISEANLKVCLERSQLPEGFTIDEDFERNYLLFVLVASCCVDYINEMGLQEGDDLHRAIVTKLADLATVYQNGFQPYTYEGFSKAIREGKIPFDRGNLSWGFDGEQFVDMPKQAIDNFARMTKDVIDISFEEKNWDNYPAVCRMAGEHFTSTGEILSRPKLRFNKGSTTKQIQDSGIPWEAVKRAIRTLTGYGFTALKRADIEDAAHVDLSDNWKKVEAALVAAGATVEGQFLIIGDGFDYDNIGTRPESGGPAKPLGDITEDGQHLDFEL